MKKTPKAKKQIPLCSFCGKTNEEVDGIIYGPEGVMICFDCACVCKAIADRKRAALKLRDFKQEPNTSSPKAEISALKRRVAVLTAKLDSIDGKVNGLLSRPGMNKRLASK